MRTTRKAVAVAVAALLVLLQMAGSVGAQPPADNPVVPAGVGVAGVTQPRLQYQGRLTDPGTGAPKPNGVYSMSFRLYNVGSGGSALWIETKDVSVQDGIFSTLLGDVTTLDHDLFSGQELWLAIKVGTDAEAAPRQQVLPVAYALSLVPGARISAASGSPALRVANTGAGEALHVDGPTALNGNLTVGGGLIGGSHTHSGADITSSTVADARIASTIARDTEVTSAVSTHTSNASAHHSRYTNAEAWNFVLASDGPGSGLNADLLDDYQGSSFFALSENEAVTGRPAFNGGTSGSTSPFTVDSTQWVQNLNADYLDGYTATSFVNVSGDTMTGDLWVPRVRYSPARTRYYSLGGEDFVPWANVDYWNSGGNGGAYISVAPGGFSLVAPLHLPDGAVVTQLRAYFYDASSYNLTLTLYRTYHGGGGFTNMASVVSSGTAGYVNGADTTIGSSTISNSSYAYLVNAYGNPWDGNNLRIKGVVITYTISEAD